MTDDICGYEDTTTGQPCQHPAGSCPVPSHSDTAPDGGNPQGRPSKFTEDRAHNAIDSARKGLSKAGCSRAAGVGKATLERWLDGRDEFRNAFRRARNEGEVALIEDGLHDPDTDGAMARFLLSTSFDYVKTEKREHATEDGGPLMVIRDGDE